MSKFYKSNAIYEYITNNNITRFEFVTGNCWQLVYGDKSGNPLLLVFVYAYNDTSFIKDTIPHDIERGYKILEQLSDVTLLPILFVAYNNSQTTIDSVYIKKDLKDFSNITLNALAQCFKSYGLPIKNTKTSKYLNDRSSSAYHNWQRDQLGNEIAVTDIDLWVRKNNVTSVIIELKRSVICLERWEPYEDDYSNFILISKLCQKAGVNFFILYNVREKNPVKDIIEYVKVFPVSYDDELIIGKGKIYKLNTLIR